MKAPTKIPGLTTQLRLRVVEAEAPYSEWPSRDYRYANLLQERPNVSRRKRPVNYAALFLAFEAGLAFGFIVLRVLAGLWGAQ